MARLSATGSLDDELARGPEAAADAFEAQQLQLVLAHPRYQKMLMQAGEVKLKSTTLLPSTLPSKKRDSGIWTITKVLSLRGIRAVQRF